jgi:anthranilate synthase component 1
MHLCRHTLPADLLTPLAAYLALRQAGASLLLESADRGERVGRHSFVLLEGKGEVKRTLPAQSWVEDLRALAGPALEHAIGVQDPAGLGGGREALPVGVGIAGYLGFEALAALEPSIPTPGRNSLDLPTVWAKRFEGALVFDHLHQIAELQVLAASEAEGFQRLREWAGRLTSFELPPVEAGAPVARPLMDQGTYESIVRKVQAYIHDGDVYQLVPSQRIEVQHPPAPLSTYRALRRLNPSPYGFLLEWEGFALAGASPEMLVRVAAGQAETLPIAGTAPRGETDAEDQARFESLKADPKELAEHQMLVDLARNDLGRIAVPGGVRVESPLALQKTSHVLHLTTTVKAEVRPDLDALDVLASAFPAGTVSGAPKIRAAQRIAELEGEARGPYGGALIRLGADGVLDSALILRTVVYAKDRAFLQAGAGVVKRSDPTKEYLETLHKMGAPAQALGVALHFPESVEVKL